MYFSMSGIISEHYGYVVFVVVATWVLLNWMAMQVMKARKKYDVKVGISAFLDLIQLINH